MSPTSVPSERAFSVAGVFMSKRRGSMSATTFLNFGFLIKLFKIQEEVRYNIMSHSVISIPVITRVNKSKNRAILYRYLAVV